MAVTEALMSLFLKELVSVDRVLATVRRFRKAGLLDDPEGDDAENSIDQEEALLYWVEMCCQALKNRVAKEQEEEDEVIP